MKLSETGNHTKPSIFPAQIERVNGQTHLPAAGSPVKPSSNFTEAGDDRLKQMGELQTTNDERLLPDGATKDSPNAAIDVCPGRGRSSESKRDDRSAVADHITLSAVDGLFGLNVDEWLKDDIVDECVASIAPFADAAAVDSREASKSADVISAAFTVHIESAIARDERDVNSPRQTTSVGTTLRDVTNTISDRINSEMRKYDSSVDSHTVKAKSPKHSIVIASSSGSRLTGQGIGNKSQTGSAAFRTPRQIAADIKTPLASNSRCFQTLNTPSSRQTPRSSGGGVTPSLMKQTPPLCDCGCRAKRKIVQSPGPNMGRWFFCCGSSRAKSNCNFFKWEQPASSPASAGSLSNVITPSASGSHSMSFGASTAFGVTPISVRPRCVPVTRVLVPPPKP
jgi:hypothetical protein